MMNIWMDHLLQEIVVLIWVEITMATIIHQHRLLYHVSEIKINQII